MCSARGGARVRELIEAVPECDGVEASGVGHVIDRSRGHIEAERACERVSGRIHIDAGEGPVIVTRNAQERTDVAADLQPVSGLAGEAGEAGSLCGVARALVVEEGVQRIGIGCLIAIELDEGVGALPRIAKQQGAGIAACDRERRSLRERDAVVEQVGWCIAANAAGVKGPQLFELIAHVIGGRDDGAVVGVAGRAGPELIAGGHGIPAGHLACRRIRGLACGSRAAYVAQNVFRQEPMARTPSTMLELGTTAPRFELPDTDGNLVSMDDFARAPALLVMFICNHCPFVKHVRSELAAIGREYGGRGAGIVAISSNDPVAYPEDAPEQMRIEKQDAGYTFAYLFDATQEVAAAYRAACTPDFFLFDADRQLVYRGQLDDSRPGNGVPVTGRDLRAALDAVLAGRPVAQEQRPSLGCNIKWRPGNEPAWWGHTG